MPFGAWRLIGVSLGVVPAADSIRTGEPPGCRREHNASADGTVKATGGVQHIHAPGISTTAS